MKTIKIALFALLTFTTIALMAQRPTVHADIPLVSVTGEAEMRVVPNQLTFSVGIETEGKNLLEAKRDNTTRVNKVLDYLRKQGIADKNIQTQYVNVSRRYNGSNRIDPTFQASQYINVKLTDISKFDQLNIGLLEQGVTNLNGPNFSVSNEKELIEQVRIKALLNARERATRLAQALGNSIGSVFSISDVKSTNGGMMYARTAMAEAYDSSGGGISKGEIVISHSVDAAFTLK